MKLKDLPKEERPREHLLKYGASNLSNEDLISILIRTGTKNKNVKELSSEILSKIKLFNNLDELSVRELTKINGLGESKALTIISAIELGRRVSIKTIPDRITLNKTDIVNKYFSNLITSSNQEELLVILLDNKTRLITYKIMYKGTSNESSISTREIYRYAIKEGASAIILMHNHPSGIVSPSDADIKVTKSIYNAGKIIGIPLVDHIITNGSEYYSFYNEMIKREE